MPDPYPKAKQLARGERRYRRKVASPKQWQAIIAAKGPTCRLSDGRSGFCSGSVEYHHLISRAQLGDDIPDNIVPLCHHHHFYAVRHGSLASVHLAESLSDAEYAYVIGKLGEGAMQRLFGV